MEAKTDHIFVKLSDNPNIEINYKSSDKLIFKIYYTDIRS
ncbi:lantibiotic mersacidin modifying enzyme [Streptococcus troglodytae]|uniref:Lantibiotic mersacidin modifying enzyme n=1 Tax=Streptococcus troglodytae TaxID=1111760 RepID=A0A1L7LLK4_9STRE|nr:lantibiotic mersacidin modifying enzyme [Streptococcus troglodytae]